MIDPVVHKPADDAPRPRADVDPDLTAETRAVDPSGQSTSALEAGRVPCRIGPYTITRKLGEGGMGIVYAAHDERLDRAVALKTMSALVRDQTARTRFWREARAAAQVNHPNICQVYEIGESGGELFIAMELLSGEALAEHLRQGPLSASRTVAIGLEILAALAALHARGIVHRDLKPSNVFLTPYGVKAQNPRHAPLLSPSPFLPRLARYGGLGLRQRQRPVHGPDVADDVAVEVGLRRLSDCRAAVSPQ